MIIPASCILTSFVDFLISGVFLVALMIWYRFIPPANVLWLPLFALAAFAAAFGVGLWIAALMVKYRDFRIIVPFVVQFGLYVSPVGFLSKVVPEKWRLLYSLNPVVGVIDGFRWCILGGEHQLYLPGVVVSFLGIVILLSSGIWYFRKTEQTFADII
jgi:lipopolysaccharide transport system permease protein